MLKVTKFGGSSMADAGQYRKVRDILFADPELSLPEHRTLRDSVEKMFGKFGEVGIN